MCWYHARGVKVKDGNLAQDSGADLYGGGDECCGWGGCVSWFDWDSPCHPGTMTNSIPLPPFPSQRAPAGKTNSCGKSTQVP